MEKQVILKLREENQVLKTLQLNRICEINKLFTTIAIHKRVLNKLNHR